jgi:hypothetical protein
VRGYIINKIKIVISSKEPPKGLVTPYECELKIFYNKLKIIIEKILGDLLVKRNKHSKVNNLSLPLSLDP